MNRLVLTRNLICLAVLLASSAAQAEVTTVTGSNVALLPAAQVFTTATGTSATGPIQASPGTLGRFDSTLGVLIGAVATASFAPATPPAHLIVGGGTGSASARSTWSLGGNSGSQVVINSAIKGYDDPWKPISLTSSAANLNNFVGAGNIATNSFASYISVSRSSGGYVYAHPGTSLTAKQVLNYSESINYTYRTHSNASFASGGDVNGLTIDFGPLANGASADQSFSLYDLGGLGLKNFSASYLSGDNVFDVDGVNGFAAGASGSYSAEFDGQSPGALTSYSGIYRLTFADDVSGLAQYASNSVGTNYIDLTMTASVAAPVPEPETYAMMLAGLGMMGFIARRRKQQDAA